MPQSFCAPAVRPDPMDHFTRMLAVIEGATKKQPPPKQRKTTVSPTELLALRAQKQPWLAPLLSLLEKNSLTIAAFQNRQLNSAAVLRLTLRPAHPLSKQTFWIDVNDTGYFSCPQDMLPMAVSTNKALMTGLDAISDYIRHLPQIQDIAAETGTPLHTAYDLFREPWALFLARSILKPKRNKSANPVLRKVTFGIDMVHFVVASQEVLRCGAWTQENAPAASLCVWRNGNSRSHISYPPNGGGDSAQQQRSVQRIYAPLFQKIASSASTLGLLLPSFVSAKDQPAATRAALSRPCFIKPLVGLALQDICVLDFASGQAGLALHVVRGQRGEAPLSGIVRISPKGTLSCVNILTGGNKLAELVVRAQAGAPQELPTFSSLHRELGCRPAFGAFSSLNFVSARGCDHLER